MAKDPDKLKKTIKALFDKAKSAGELGNEREAETFMAKAQELLMKYNLEREDLSEDDKAKGITVDYHTWFKKSESDWVFSLFCTLARYNFCECVQRTGRDWVIIGTSENGQTVGSLGEWLIPEVRHMARNKMKQEWSGNPNTYLRGFYRGFVSGLDSKLREEQSNQLEQAKKVLAGDTTLPAVMGNLPKLMEQHVALRDAFKKIHFPNLRSSSSRGLSGHSGFSSGRNAGKNANLKRAGQKRI
tara:strand:+ start:658 stop:1386 length:729 start_codon:yes stop_codon:yes gene_type:complete